MRGVAKVKCNKVKMKRIQSASASSACQSRQANTSGCSVEQRRMLAEQAGKYHCVFSWTQQGAGLRQSESVCLECPTGITQALSQAAMMSKFICTHKPGSCCLLPFPEAKMDKGSLLYILGVVFLTLLLYHVDMVLGHLLPRALYQTLVFFSCTESAFLWIISKPNAGSTPSPNTERGVS